MKFEMDLRHPRRLAGGKLKPFKCCRTTTGSYGCLCKKNTRSDLEELGLGITLYFKMLKFLIFLFAWFSFLSAPALFYYY